MARLTNLKSGLSTIAPSVAYISTDAKSGPHATPSERWMRSARWLKLRLRVLARDLYTCQMCGRIVGVTKGSATVDHIKPHRENARLFWDETNLQTLCSSPCHSKHKQIIEQADPRGVWD